MKIIYGQRIEWHDTIGSKTAVFVKGYDSAEEALIDCVKLARKCGWGYPKWWQWWRWHDTRPFAHECKKINKASL